MKMWSTPSQKAHHQVNPIPLSRGMGGGSDFLPLLWIKRAFGSPIPLLFFLYPIVITTTMSGMEFVAWGIAGFTLIYVLADQFCRNREFSFFYIPGFLALSGFVLVSYFGLKINAPEADFWEAYGQLKWIPLLALVTYSLTLFPGINKLYYILIAMATIIGAYGIFQHFTGMDLRFIWGLRDASAVTPAPHSNGEVFQSVGLFSHHLTYGYAFSLIICFPFAALLYGRYKSLLFRALMAISVTVIGMSLIWTYGRGVWMATGISMLIMAGYLSKRSFGVILTLLMGIFIGMYSFSDSFSERFNSFVATNYTSNSDRRDIWRANLEMFSDHPWIGVGYMQNDPRTYEYYEKLGITNQFKGHAHNTYFQTLATTGSLGFLFYMLFIISVLLVTHRLWVEIPKTHYWHRVIVLGAIGAQFSLHIGGLTQWNFGDAEVLHVYVFILASVLYLYEKYSTTVIPDDHSL